MLKRSRKTKVVSEEERALSIHRYETLLSHIYSGDYGDYRYVDMPGFFRLLFERRGQLRLQEQGREHYFDGHYNAIVRLIGRGRFHASRWWIVNDSLDGLRQFFGAPFAVVAPITYAGKERTLFGRKEDKDGNERADHDRLGNARYLFAIVIDLDCVLPGNMHNLHGDIDRGLYPDPTFIVTSGGGLHLYYCFEKPILITRKNVSVLNRLKHTLTRAIWRYKMTSNQQSVEIHDVNQAYRLPDTLTKCGRDVHAFTRHQTPLYHTPTSLNGYIKEWYKNRPELFGEDRPVSDAAAVWLEGNRMLTAAEARALEKDIRLPAHWSIETARKKFGEDWYRTVLEKGSVDWKKYSKSLYEHWLYRLRFGVDVTVGHRYWCLWMLAAWAWNCRIPYWMLRRDAFSLIKQFNDIRDGDGNVVPFEEDDAYKALSIYRERKEKGGPWKPIRVSRAKMSRITALIITPAKRNFRSKGEHVRYMNQNYNFLHDEEYGGDGINTRVPRIKEDVVARWRAAHPGVENKSLCARELGLSRPTVIKWWN